jgi:hypothetical protein
LNLKKNCVFLLEISGIMNRSGFFMKCLYFLLIAIPVSSVCFAQDGADGSFTRITPLASYEYLHLAQQQFYSPGEELTFTRGEGQNLFMLQASAKQYFLEQENPAGHEYEGPYHADTLVILQKTGAHQFLALFDSSSPEPVYGGLRTFGAGIGYRYELMRTERASLVAGGYLVVTDSGMEYGDGKIWPLYPKPSIVYEFGSEFFALEASLSATPELGFTLLPENKVRLIAGASLSLDRLRGARDLLFDCALWYRFFDKDSEDGDFAGLGVGIKNSGLCFDFGEKNKSYEVQYYSLYGTLDLSFVQISGGYCFQGREIFDSASSGSFDNTRTLGGGYFVSVQLTYSF